MRGCQSDVLQALLLGKLRGIIMIAVCFFAAVMNFIVEIFVGTMMCFIIIVTVDTTGNQQLLTDEDSRLAAASVVGIGSPSPAVPPPPPSNHLPLLQANRRPTTGEQPSTGSPKMLTRPAGAVFAFSVCIWFFFLARCLTQPAAAA